MSQGYSNAIYNLFDFETGDLSGWTATPGFVEVVTDADDACPATPPFTSVTLIGCPLDPDLTNNTFTKTIVDAEGELLADAWR